MNADSKAADFLSGTLAGFLTTVIIRPAVIRVVIIILIWSRGEH